MDTKKNYQLDIWSDSIFFNDCCNQELEVKKATTFLEIIKTTLINTVYFLLLTVFGNVVAKNMTKIKARLYTARLKKLFK